MMFLKYQRAVAAALMLLLASGMVDPVGSWSTSAVGADAAPGDPAGMPPLLQVDVGSAVVNIAIFIGVLVILSKLIWPVILRGLDAREAKIHGDLQSAHQANLEARALLASYDSKISEASTQVQQMLAEAQKASEAERQRMIADAKNEAETHRQRALADIEQAKKVAISELAGQTSDMALAVARKIVGRELRADDHAELIRQSLERLPSNN
jgi:F-type H+-transporting ATPase subunit b